MDKKKEIELDILEINQHIGTMYLSKMDGNLLYQLSKADILKIKNKEMFEGIQRELDKRRVRQIKAYLETQFSSFPNSIILNISSQDIISVNSCENKMVVRAGEKTFSIIDGQHRLSGFEDGDIENFELPIAIFIDLEDYDQALLFSTINSEQVKVDPSQKLSLELYSKVDTPKKKVTEMVYAFNMDKESPWYSRIKLTGKKDELSENAIIALKTFATPIIEFVYDDRDNYIIRDLLTRGRQVSDMLYDSNKYIFWKFYESEKMEMVYKMLFNYFCVMQEILPDDWGNTNSVLTKSTGYNAMMKLFKDIFGACYSQNRDFSKKNMYAKLVELSKLQGMITAEKYGGSGYGASNYLYMDMIKYVDLSK